MNLTVLYYQYTKHSQIDYFLPIYQFSFNYPLKISGIENNTCK
jgi:hypothetical protein